jgi:hypothetical protein
LAKKEEKKYFINFLLCGEMDAFDLSVIEWKFDKTLCDFGAIKF